MANIPNFAPTVSAASTAMKAGASVAGKWAKKLRKYAKNKKVKSLRTPDGKAIVNSRFRGSVNPRGLEKGFVVPVKKNGYPDFSKYYHRQKPPPLRITMTGDRAADIRAANKKAKFNKTPEGYTWHHSENLRTQNGVTTCEMQLVRTDAHDAVRHSGGCQKYKAIPGNEGAY